MLNPKLSVIMGIYNSNKREMVKSAIDSVLNQTYTDFEFIICDDGSIDGTWELVNDLTKHDNRVVIIRNEVNSGLAATLNKCLKIARGEYIARMDADDICYFNRFEKQVKFLEENSNYALVGCNSQLFDEIGVWGERKSKEIPKKKDFLLGTQFMHPTIIIRKVVIDEVSGYRAEKETLRCEDYDMFMRIYSLGYIGYNIQECLYKFREDKNAYKRRAYKFRLDEAKVRFRGFKALGLMTIGVLYVVKPLVVGIIPQEILAKLRNEKII